MNDLVFTRHPVYAHRVSRSPTEAIKSHINQTFNDRTWTEAVSVGASSPFVKDVITKLNSIVPRMYRESVAGATMVVSNIYKHLSNKFMKLLNEADAVSIDCMKQMQQDIQELDRFAGMFPSIVIDKTCELRQILALALESDWNVYIGEFGKHGKYHMVKSSTALALLEKIIKFEEQNFRVLRSHKRQQNHYLQKLRDLLVG